jgi:hypothetical protein
MRVPSLVLAACVLVAGSWRVAADPISPPSSLSGWADDEARRFALTWDGQIAAFSVDQVGTSTSRTLDQCCTDLFAQMASLHQGSTLLVSGLVLNGTTPVGKTFADGINFQSLRDVTPNITSLTGYLTLDLPFAAGPFVLDFSPQLVPPDGDPPLQEPVPSVPEPTTLMLMGTGLLAIGKLMQRRQPRQ